MDSRLPITLVTGFLGAGKTTLIRRLLDARADLRIGLVLNELGQAGIDQMEAARSAFVELTEGCACCVMNPDLIATLQELSARGDLDRVIVETSGLADPLPLTWTMTRPELVERVRLDAVITVVDAANHARTRTEEWESQIRTADLVVFSKLDLAPDAEAARSAVRAVNPRARLVDGREVPAEVILDRAPDDVRAARPAPAAARHSDFRAVLFSGSETYDSDALEDFLEELPAEVFRAKGVVPLAGGGWASFQVVAGRLHYEPDAPPPPHREGRLVFFGPRLERALLEPRLGACQAPPPGEGAPPGRRSS